LVLRGAGGAVEMKTITVKDIKIGLRVAIGHAFKDVQRMKRVAKRNPNDAVLVIVARDQLREMMAVYTYIDTLRDNMPMPVKTELFSATIVAEIID
jgi:hypothetical protein